MELTSATKGKARNINGRRRAFPQATKVRKMIFSALLAKNCGDVPRFEIASFYKNCHYGDWSNILHVVNGGRVRCLSLRRFVTFTFTSCLAFFEINLFLVDITAYIKQRTSYEPTLEQCSSPLVPKGSLSLQESSRSRRLYYR